MVGAPVGTAIAGMIPETVLLALFSALMLLVAGRMWQKSAKPQWLGPVCDQDGREPACQRTEDGRLRLTSRCAMLLLFVGLTTGFLSGMFGVGGGFVIVPALVLFSGMPIHKAVATSLLVIVLHLLGGMSAWLSVGLPVVESESTTEGCRASATATNCT
jgi:hypothetical protein